MVQVCKSLIGLLAIIVAMPAAAEPTVSVVRSADGTSLLMAQEGDRNLPGILMIHGFGQSHLSFRRQFSSDLAQRFHLVSFDLRGHGGSAKPSEPAAYTDVSRSADDVAAVINAAGLRRPVILAWSYGGIVAGDYVRKYGTGNISGVVFAGTTGGLARRIPAAQSAKAPALVVALKTASSDSRALDLGSNISGGQVISDAYATAQMSTQDKRILFATEMMLPAYARRALAQRPYDNSDLIHAFAVVPTLFVRGETDLGMPEAELALLARSLPMMKLSRYARVGHLSFFVAPKRFNSELAAFANLALARRVDPAAALARPSLPMSAAMHRAFRDREFAARDTNGNGLFEPEEIRATSGGTITAEALARAIRINCGADLQSCPLDLYRKHGDAEFRNVDGNGDGVVTADELKAAGGFHKERF